MPVRGASKTIYAAETNWPNVTAHPHRFGGTEYLLGERREIGHVHGDSLVDLPLPTKVRDEVIASGRAHPHHILPDSGWVSFYIRESADVERAIELFRLSYELAAKQRTRTSSEAKR